jgi:signal transduction histidine kinase/ActR/RegA family two-component response regulator
VTPFSHLAARFEALSFRQLLIMLTAALTLIVALLAARDLYLNSTRLTRAYDLREAIETSDLLFDATAKIAVERDLVLSMLHAPDAETVDLLRPTLIEARREADAAVYASIAALDEHPNQALGNLRRAFESQYAAIGVHRTYVDRALSQPRERRDLRFAETWEATATRLIEETEALWLAHISPFTGVDATVTQHVRYLQALRTITDYTGRRRSIIGQLLAENAPPSSERSAALLRAEGVIDEAWRNARVAAEQSGLYVSIASAYADAESHYATLQDMTRGMFEAQGPLTRWNGYAIGPDLWFELSSQAAESLSVLRDVSRARTSAHLNGLIAQTEREIAFQISISLLAMVLCAASFWLVIRRVVLPISRITDALVRASRGETVEFVLERERRDEIGKLAHVLQELQQSMRETERAAAERDEAARLLEGEVVERRVAQQRVSEQLERLALLHQISRAIAEREELASVLFVAAASVEEHLPADFVCVCMFDAPAQTLQVARLAPKSLAAAATLAMHEGAEIEIDGNGLSRCMAGNLVYEPDVEEIEFPFPQRLRGAGLRSFVAAPLQVESKVFGALIVARAAPNAFSSGECEFLRQLSEHVALAAHQVQLNTALQQAYDELRQTQDAVMQQERLRALGQMASGIAHDINNALSPVALYTEALLATEPGLTPAGRNKLEIVQRAIDDAARTIARMNEFYRRREIGLDVAPVDANTLMQQVIDLTQARWRDMPQQRGQVIEMRTEFSPEPLTIKGVESELREALTNLVFNAIDAMPEGGAVTLRTRRDADDAGLIHLEVEDTGCGMDEETRQHCLEPFFTTKGERGTGLGLAMVYGAVQRHGGAFDIESEPGRGTLMRLSLAAAGRSAHGNDDSEDARPAERLRLLVIDDDPIVLRSLREALGGDGHAVTACGDGEAGVDAFKAHLAQGKTFDAVITDLGMPRMDGRRVAQEIKQASPGTPVLLLTGWGERLRAEEDTPAHIDCVLSKPPRLKQLRAALARSYRPRQARA